MTRSFYVYVLGLLSAMLLCVGSLSAATGTLMPSPWFYALDTNGNPISLAKACFYVAGTSTSATTYSDVLLTTPNANPLRGDTSGRVGPIYLVPGQSYKLILQDSTGTAGNCDGAVVRTQDNIAAVPSSAASVDITATAGEAITAGQCVYWSDGSGSKTPGSIYKCDSANLYSSVSNEVGIATASIASGSAGNVRTAGQVTGLTVSAGSEYFIGTSGALTSTAPANRRHLGHADSATTLILTGNPQPLPVTAIVDDFRLGASTASCAPTSDVTAATTLYLTPCVGNKFTVSDSSGNLTTLSSAEISIAVPATTSQMYDVWAYNNSGTLTLELLAWTNDTTRATAIARATTGFITKSGDLTRRYVGSFRTTGVSGQTEDSVTKRYVWNYYNRVRRPMYRSAGSNFTTASTSYVQANASTANQLDFVVGAAEIIVTGNLFCRASSDGGAGATFNQAVGFDSTSAASAETTYLNVTAGSYVGQTVLYNAIPAVGRHFIAWLVKVGSNTGTFYSTDTGVGLTGWIEG